MADLMPNETMFIQLALFLASFFVLKTLIFDPYLKLLHLRHSKTTGLKDAAEKAKHQALKYQADYEEYMKAERKKIAHMVDAERKTTADEERTIIETARTQVAQKLEGLRKDLHESTEKTRKELSPFANEFSSKIASKLVGYNVTVSGVSADNHKGRTEEVRG
jgi:F0F1-type ATP synthase membrane subunit b/b'